MPMGKVYLKRGDLVRWIGPSIHEFIGKTTRVESIKDGNPATLIVAQTTEMTRVGLGQNWGSAPMQWEVVEKVNPRNEWGEEGL